VALEANDDGEVLLEDVRTVMRVTLTLTLTLTPTLP